MHWRFIETAFSDTAECRFNADTLSFDRSVNTNAGSLQMPTVVFTTG